MSSQERQTGRLERVDSHKLSGQTLPDQLGRRLRNVFVAPETQGDAFDDLLKRISGILP